MVTKRRTVKKSVSPKTSFTAKERALAKGAGKTPEEYRKSQQPKKKPKPKAKPKAKSKPRRKSKFKVKPKSKLKAKSKSKSKSKSKVETIKGNNFWRRYLGGEKRGPKNIFFNSEELLEAAENYFQWVDDNPLIEIKYMTVARIPVAVEVPKIRAMSIDDLCLHLEISRSTLTNYRNKEGFEYATERIDAVIRTQKFQGAAAGLLDSNIISRDLGLKDHSDITTNEEPIKRITRTIIHVPMP